MKHRIPKTQRKVDVIQLRVTTEQKQSLAVKAQRRGLSLSSWLLSLGMGAPERPMVHEGG